MQRFKSFYLNFRVENDFRTILFTFVFLIRRLLFALTIVFLEEQSSLQILINVILSMGLMVIGLKLRPYDTFQQNFFELFNEASIILMFILMMPLIMNEVESGIRVGIGYTMISLCLVNALVNWISLMISICTSLKATIKRKCSKKQERSQNSE